MKKKFNPGAVFLGKFNSIQSVIFAMVSMLLLGAVAIVTVISMNYTRTSVFDNS